MKVNRFVLPVVAIALLLGTVGIAKSLGWWQTSGVEVVDLEELTVNDVKGWMSLQEVSDGLGIPITELYEIIGVPEDFPPTTPMNKLEESIEGFDMDTARLAIGEYMGEEVVHEEEEVEKEATAAPVETESGPTSMPEGEIVPGSEIKGSWTLQSVSDSCGIPPEQLYSGLGLPDDTPPETQLKGLIESGLLSEVQVVRDLVTAYQEGQ